MNRFIEICKIEQIELKKMLKIQSENKYKFVYDGDGFLYAKGNIPVLVTAHLDTVHKSLPKEISVSEDIKGRTILSSPQGIGGDDRCGVWIISGLLKEDLYPHLLFCEDEEIGCVGSYKFCKTEYIEELKKLNYFIGLDRKGNNDAVFYNCENRQFQDFITRETGYKKAKGSFSDISVLSPKTGIAGVNLSCGYYNAHTASEYVVFEEMQRTLSKVKYLLSLSTKQYNYQEAERISDFYEDYDMKYLDVLWEDEKGRQQEETYEGETEGIAWAEFFMNNPHVSIRDILDWNFM